MATISAVSICNVALSQLGEKPIHSMTDDSSNASWCSMFYDTARRTNLMLANWNFAIKRAELPQDLATPVYGFKYQYSLPSDFLRLISCSANEYKREENKILTNDASMFVRYVSDVTDVSAWSQGFVNVMQTAMRKDLAFPVTTDLGQVSAAETLYDKTMKLAKLTDTSEDTSSRLGHGVSALIAVRG